MNTSQKAINAIKRFEGLSLSAYLCPAGVWTIGYGHTRGVKRGQVIDRPTADKLLVEDLISVERDVLRQTNGVPLTQGQFDALVSFVFNLGASALATSTLLRYIRQRRSAPDIAAQFGRWVYGRDKAGKPIKLNGLINRRAWEAARWQETN